MGALRNICLKMGKKFSRALVNWLRTSVLHFRSGKHPFERFHRKLWLVGCLMDNRLAVVGVGKFWIRYDGTLKTLDSLIGFPPFLMHYGETVQRPRIIRCYFQCLAKKLFTCLFIRFLAYVEVGKHHPTPRIAWVQAENFNQVICGVIHITNLNISHRQITTGGV